MDKVDETEQLDKTRTRAIYLRLQDFGSKIMLFPSTFAMNSNFFRAPVDIKQETTLVMAKYATFRSMKYANPNYHRNEFLKIRKEQSFGKEIEFLNPLYCCTYHTEYGKKSFYQISHFINKNNNKDEYIGDTLTLNIRSGVKMLDNNTKQLCDETWNKCYTNKLKTIYKTIKNNLSQNITDLNMNYKKNQNDNELFLYLIKFRYVDQDILGHINNVSDFQLIEECLVNFDKNILKKQNIIYSISIVYWKVTKIKQYKYCYVVIRDKKNIIFKDKEDNKNYKGIDYYGTISVCKKCCQSNDTNTVNDCNHTHNWENQRGFVARIVNKKPAKL
eukprot:357002_1